MGKAYSEAQRTHVRGLLEAGRDEESIEKETGVSDRTIRRWKLELERTGRIGKVNTHPSHLHPTSPASGMVARAWMNRS